MEVVKEMGKYLIVKYYADTLYSDEDKESGYPYYGDIYLTKEDVFKDHPESEILEGYGVLYNETYNHPEDAPDWFYTIDEVIRYIELR
jgi:hypothetical protein